MRVVQITIVGAGASGLVTASVLSSLGHDVAVYEKAPDVGGCWSATRAYPNVSAQDDRVSYAYSDLPMTGVDEHPTGAQMQAYLERYGRRKGLDGVLHLGAEVLRATPHGEGWQVEVADADGTSTHETDWLVMASGVFCTPYVPDWPGRAQFEAAGGQVVVPTALGDGAVLAGKRVLVVGWGKTACDVSAASAAVATSTAHVARTIRWKMPLQVAGPLTYRHLLETRAGEYLLAPARGTSGQRAAALATAPLRRVTIAALEAVIERSTHLREVGMVPFTPLPHCDSLVTEDFFEGVADGRIDMYRERSVRALVVHDGVPGVELSGGAWLPVDVVVPATGFEQDLSLLDPSVTDALRDADGVMTLYRRTLHPDVPRLAFAGWGNTYRSLLSAEVGAVWLGGYLAGVVRLPGRERMLGSGERFLLSHEQAARLHEQQIPSGSFAVLDEQLADLGSPLPRSVKARQWAVPIRPSDYAFMLPALQQRIGSPSA